MNESSFSVMNYSQKVRVQSEHVNSYSDGLCAFLNIPISLNLHQPNAETAFDLLAISAQLKCQMRNVLLSEVLLQPGFTVRSNSWEGGQTLTFKLEERVIYHIEKNRKDDVNFALEMTFLISVRNKIPLSGGQAIYPTDFLSREQVRLQFQIPRSVWIEKTLPQLGYKNLRLVEIPLSHRQLKEAYADIIFEFEKAEHYFNTHDYNKSVAHCRNTLDALHRNLLKIKNEKKIETAFQWLEKITAETFTWITEVDKATFGLASKSHHVGHKKDFKRFEAEAIYLVVLGLLNFVGNIDG